MKKIIAISCALIFALCFAGCGNKNNTGSSKNNGISSMESNVGSTVSGVVSGTESIIGGIVSNTESAVNGVTGSSRPSNTAGRITADEAKGIALKHAGLKENDVKIIKVDLDSDDDDGIEKYEIEFKHNNTEYEYDINAKTGEIISHDKDKD